MSHRKPLDKKRVAFTGSNKNYKLAHYPSDFQSEEKRKAWKLNSKNNLGIHADRALGILPALMLFSEFNFQALRFKTI
jgi:hypothetical protein